MRNELGEKANGRFYLWAWMAYNDKKKRFLSVHVEEIETQYFPLIPSFRILKEI